MRTANLGPLGPVSRLTIGGGGIGEAWGPTSRGEVTATLRAAVDGGITLIDTAPMYLNCEKVVAETFEGRLPAGGGGTSQCPARDAPQDANPPPPGATRGTRLRGLR